MQLRPPSTKRNVLALMLLGISALALIGSPALGARARRKRPVPAKKAVDTHKKVAPPRPARPVLEKEIESDETDDKGAPPPRRVRPVVEKETESDDEHGDERGDERGSEDQRPRPAADAVAEDDGESAEA